MLKAIIMAGGRGERFWPYSRESHPKPLLKIISNKTMLEETIHRLKPLIPEKDIYIVTLDFLVPKMKKLLPQVNYISEPANKNTAPCLGFTALHLNPEDLMFIETADHVYQDVPSYLKHIQAAVEIAQQDRIVLIGIKPTHPHTGLGYIHQGHLFKEVSFNSMKGPIKAYQIKEFKEKPDLGTAKKFLASQKYLWNSGMYVVKAKLLLALLKKHQPAMYQGLIKIKQSNFDPQITKEEFEKFEFLSLEYAAIEKEKDLIVLRAEMPWDDIGDWLAMERIYPKNAEGNIVKGDFTGLETKNCLIFSNKNKLTATFGLKNLIIINTPDTTLICSKDKARELKKLYQKLKKEKKFHKYLQ